ncbi:MAG TPA: hypothetical protein VJ738_07785 [Steroidobacteraceae bacterium]|nr:hypothetical protein [Steroidobacteraceae bacterium]
MSAARLLFLLALAALAACRAWPASPGLPALITEVSAASRADLERAVSQALGGAPVRLADDALTRDSVLIVGRAQIRNVNGVPLNGRELGRPQHFQLMEKDSRCVLLHLETGRSSVLPHTHCRPSPSAYTRK